MAFPDDILEGILISRGSPFARNKGFSERFDKVFQDSGYKTNGTTGTSLLYDVRALYGFFLWLQNNSGEDIDFEVFFSYKNFDNVTELTQSLDWVDALEADGVTPIAGTISDTEDAETEFVRISSRVTAIRIDIESTSNVDLDGTFSAV